MDEAWEIDDVPIYSNSTFNHHFLGDLWFFKFVPKFVDKPKKSKNNICGICGYRASDNQGCDSDNLCKADW